MEKTIEANKKKINELGNLRWDFYKKIIDKFTELDLDNIKIPLRVFDEYLGDVVEIEKGIIKLDTGERIPFEGLDWEERIVLIDALDNLVEE